MENIKFKQTHFFWILLLILLPVFLSLFFAKQYHLGTKPITHNGFWITLSILTFCLLLFYKMTVIISEKQLKVSFGFGLIKKNFLLENIDKNSIEIVKIPWYYGAGIRFTPQGTLFNVKSGTVVKFRCKNSNYLIGIKNPELFIKILKSDI